MGVLSLDVPLANETSKPQARTFYVVKKLWGPKRLCSPKTIGARRWFKPARRSASCLCRGSLKVLAGGLGKGNDSFPSFNTFRSFRRPMLELLEGMAPILRNLGSLEMSKSCGFWYYFPYWIFTHIAIHNSQSRATPVKKSPQQRSTR